MICIAGAAAIAAIGVAENAATAETNNRNGRNESDTKKQEREILMAESKALLSRSSARAVLLRCSLIPDYQHMHRSRNGVGAVVGGEGGGSPSQSVVEKDGNNNNGVETLEDQAKVLHSISIDFCSSPPSMTSIITMLWREEELLRQHHTSLLPTKHNHTLFGHVFSTKQGSEGAEFNLTLSGQMQ